MKCAARLAMILATFDYPSFVSQFLQIGAFTTVLVVRVVPKIVSPSHAWKETVSIMCFGLSPFAESFQLALTTIRVGNLAVGLMILAQNMLWCAAHMEATRKLASILLQSEGLLYSQWFPGIENVVADALSQDFHTPDDKLMSLLSSLVPQQIPPHFHISPVPKETHSWVISLLRKQPSTKQSPKEPQRSKLLLGRDGRSISSPSASATASSLTISSRTSAHTPFDLAQRWQCSSPTRQSSSSCYKVDGRPTLSFDTLGSR